MLERNAGEVSVVADGTSVRRPIGRLARRLGLVGAARRYGRAAARAGVILFHLAGSSEQALRDLREVVRHAFPAP
jgi:hypothetical protein